METLLLPLALLFLAAPVVAIVALVWASRLERRVRTLEAEMRGRVDPDRTMAIRPPRPFASPPPAPPSAAPRPPAEPPAPAPAGPPRMPPARPTAPPSEPSFSAPFSAPAGSGAPSTAPAMELLIGTRWLNVAGIVTLLFGVAFFLKYAYDNAWIGPRGRVAIGVASGLAAIVIGDVARRRGHRVFSQGLCGGGLAALYLSFFFAFRLYSLIEIAPAFFLMAAVTACGVALALLQDSLAVALLSFIGAYLTPVLLSTGQDAAGFLFTYLAILALGALGVTWFRRWRALEILSFAGTALLYGGWHAAHYTPARLGVACTGLAVFFLLYLLIPYGHNLARLTATGPRDHALALGNAAFVFGYLYRMIYHDSPKALGFVALGLSACYLGLGALARRRLPADRAGAVAILGISIAFLTLAVPLQLGLYGITLAWAAEGLVILYLGFRYEAALTREAGLAVIALSVVRLLVKHTPLHERPFTCFFNPGFGTWALVVCAVFAAGWLYRRHAARIVRSEASVDSAALVAGTLLLLTAMNMEVWLYFGLWSLPEDGRAGAIMILWALFPIAAWLAARWIADDPLRKVSTALTFVSALPFLMLTARVAAAPDPLFGSFVFWMGVLGVAGFWVAAGLRCRKDAAPDEVRPGRVLYGAGAALLLVLLTAEVHSHYRLLDGPPEALAANAFKALLAVSIVWATYATALMALGFLRAQRPARYAAFALYAMTLVKVFAVDMAGLRAVYRIVSFVLLGLLLVTASFVYSRFRSRIAMIAAAAAAAAVASAGPAWADFDPLRWRFTRGIEVGAPAGEPPLVWVALDEEVLKESRTDLADLRVIDRDRRETPSLVSARKGGTRETSFATRILNQSTLAGGAARVDLVFDDKRTRNRLRVETPGESFRRRLKVEGSDDGAAWATIVDDAFIYRAPGTVATPGARLDEVTLPDNDYRRLRVTVFPMPEDLRTLTISGVGARRLDVTQSETAPLRSSFAVTADPNARTTTLEIDFGYRNARPFELTLDVVETAFARAYRLYARAEERTVQQRGQTERGERIEQIVETPWRMIGAGSLSRVPGGRVASATPGATTLALHGEPARQLRLVIEDEDNQPLHVSGVTATALVHRLVFPVRPGGAYTLYYGNPDAASPAYDLPALLPDLDTRPPATATFMPVTANPLAARPPEPPFSERYPWVVWAVMLTAVAVLALVVLKNARALADR